jgi:hypothetical protein
VPPRMTEADPSASGYLADYGDIGTLQRLNSLFSGRDLLHALDALREACERGRPEQGLPPPRREKGDKERGGPPTACRGRDTRRRTRG